MHLDRKPHSSEKPSVARVPSHPTIIKFENIFNESLHGPNSVRSLFVKLFQFRRLQTVHETPIYGFIFFASAAGNQSHPSLDFVSTNDAIIAPIQETFEK